MCLCRRLWGCRRQFNEKLGAYEGGEPVVTGGVGLFYKMVNVI